MSITCVVETVTRKRIRASFLDLTYGVDQRVHFPAIQRMCALGMSGGSCFPLIAHSTCQDDIPVGDRTSLISPNLVVNPLDLPTQKG
jgi:hypothetical protein